MNGNNAVPVEKGGELGEIFQKMEYDCRFTAGAIFLLAFLLLLFRFAFGIAIDYVPVMLVYALWLLAVYVFRKIFRGKAGKTADQRGLVRLYFSYCVIQMLFSVALTYFLGGIEWLGFLFPIFIVIYAVFILPAAQNFLITMLAAVFCIVEVLLEYFSVIPHHPFFIGLKQPLFQNSSYLTVTLALVVMVLYFINYSVRIFSNLISLKNKELKRSEKLYEELSVVLKKYKKLQEFNEEIIKNAPVGICLIEPDGRVSYFNPKMEELAGGKVAEKMSIWDLSGRDAELMKRLKRALEEGAAFELDSCPPLFRPPDGLLRNFKGIPIIRDGKAERLLLLDEDVTEKSHWRKEIERYNEKLEKSVQERTIQLKEKVRELEESRSAALNILEDLRIIYGELKELDKMKSEFIKVVSHQLRTPLSSMRWHLEMINGGDLGKINNDEQKKSLGYLYQNTKELIDILEHMLISMEIEEGKMFVRRQPLRMGEMIEEGLADYAEKASAKGIGVEFKKPTGYDGEISADHRKIKYILSVLLNNAIRYTDKGGQIVVELKEQKDKGGKDGMLVSVSDTGIGIPEEEMKNVFVKFYRGENAIRFSPGGIGLGLYVAKTFIGAHRGKIWVESVKGKGTTFYFSLPRGVEKEEKKKEDEAGGSGKI